MIAAGAPSFKKDVKRYVTYMANKVYRSNIEVKLYNSVTYIKNDKEEKNRMRHYNIGLWIFIK